jgi:hypothetical protein
MRLPGGTRVQPGLSSPSGAYVGHGCVLGGSGTTTAGQLARISCPRPIVRCSLQVFGGVTHFLGEAQGSKPLTAQLVLHLQGRKETEYRGP